MIAAAEPPTPTAPQSHAEALQRIAQLRAAGFELIWPLAGEMARLVRGRELIVVRAEVLHQEREVLN